MKLSTAFHEPAQSIDHSDVAEMQRRMVEAAEELNAMVGEVASALTVIEYDGEQRKRSLALVAREFLATGDSASAAETKGRGSVHYGEALEKLYVSLEAAHAVIAKRDATRLRWETARSCLSMSRATIGNL